MSEQPDGLQGLRVWCSNCQREFTHEADEEGVFVGWVRCECGQDRPPVEETYGEVPPIVHLQARLGRYRRPI